MTGVIAKLGKNRNVDTLGRPLREGDRVAFAYFIPCGSCWACLSGTTVCPNRYRLRSSLTAEDPRTSTVPTAITIISYRASGCT